MNRPGQGRPCQPPEVHLAHGTYRPGSHGVRPEEPTGPPVRPAIPAWLKNGYAMASEVWDKTCEQMEAGGIPFKVADRSMEQLVFYTCAFLKDAPAQMAGHIVLTKTNRKGIAEVLPNPLFRALRSCSEEIEKWAVNLGLTPIARAALWARIGVGGGQGEESVDPLPSMKRSS